MNQAYYIAALSTKDEKQQSECFGSLFINLMFPAALNLFSLYQIIDELYSKQKANFNLQIFTVKNV